MMYRCNWCGQKFFTDKERMQHQDNCPVFKLTYLLLDRTAILPMMDKIGVETTQIVVAGESIKAWHTACVIHAAIRSESAYAEAGYSEAQEDAEAKRTVGIKDKEITGE